ncbi:hypothetical protein [Modestobacter versicolor]|uniref:Uncharacterized protein n=1 Tax=Modestobacter versicolor TaxID=429133 RepID=A0A323V9V7_9ACTN|nr:hypothetical protein [Modestobacter versicolor]MBB3678488.1 hypothetical protein [Modestobacter versicolor]PZA21622.1 hypothetical protein DMO24_09280 [Modestobacter versicolor]
MNGALKAAWALTVFVVLAGIIGWATSGRPVFAVFIALGVLTGLAALFAFRTPPATGRPTPSSPEESK